MKLSHIFIIMAAALASTPECFADQAKVEAPVQLSDLMVSIPRPTYPVEAKLRHITGSGMCDIVFRPETGVVTRVTVLQSSGSKLLDNAAVTAFMQWRARPGKVSHMHVPFTFTFAR
jgi:TonB family protein